MLWYIDQYYSFELLLLSLFVAWHLHCILLKVSLERCLHNATCDGCRYEAKTAVKLANFGLAGAMIYESRRYLTQRKTALGLIGTSQSGKSTFASLAFEADSNPGAGKNARTRALRHWSLPFPDIKNRNRQFTLIDFPGSTDHAAPHWYIRGQSLASVLVIMLSMKEINTAQAVTLVEKVS